MADKDDKLEAIGHELDAVNWARLAAYVDGEGTITIGCPRGRFMSLRIQICNTDVRLGSWLKTNFGGSVTTVRPSNDRCKPSYLWTISCRQAQNVLQQCLPYFILKRQQAEVGLAFQSTFRLGRNQKQRLSDTEWDKRLELKAELMRLNKRGVFDGQ